MKVTRNRTLKNELKQLMASELSLVIGGAAGTPEDPVPVGKVSVRGQRQCSISNGVIEYSPIIPISYDFGMGVGVGGGFEIPLPDEASRDVYVNFPVGYTPTAQEQQRIQDTCEMLQRLDIKINSISDMATISMNNSMFSKLGMTGKFENLYISGAELKDLWKRLDIQINAAGTSYTQYNPADPTQEGIPLMTDEGVLLQFNVDLIQDYFDAYQGIAGIEFLIAHDFAHMTRIGTTSNDQIWKDNELTGSEKSDNEQVANDIAKILMDIYGGQPPSSPTYGYGNSVKEYGMPTNSPAPWEYPPDTSGDDDGTTNPQTGDDGVTSNPPPTGGGGGTWGGGATDTPYQPIN